jgi:anti-anti-sigma factor
MMEVLMSNVNVTLTARRVNEQVSVIDIQGEITGHAENALMDAYAEASSEGVQAILLNFAGLEYMNSSGISLLVLLLVRMRRQQQRLLACCLNEHYRHILELTRLAEVIGVYESEGDALAALA